MTQSSESLFRIYNSRGEPVGAGFWVGARLGLTCWHVVQAAAPGAGIGAAICLDFPCLSGAGNPPRSSSEAKIVFLDPTIDLAGLELSAELPAEARPVTLLDAAELWDHPFRAIGFPRGYPDGVWASGRILERNAQGWLQIENSPAGYAVQPGFSGGPIWDETLNGVVGMVVAADKAGRGAYILPSEGLARAWPDLAGFVVSTARDADAPAPGEPPYMGLRYFDIADAGRFYGRESLVHALAARLAGETFLAVVGASGSGKSSLARAGLVPAWQAGLETPAGRLSGPVYVITPGAHPLENLAASLTRASESVRATAILMDDLSRDARSLRLYARKLAGLDGQAARLLLVDQFEETFTLCKDPAERRAWIDNLLAAGDPESGLRVVLTLRADFYHACAEYENLRLALEKHQSYIGAMTPAELRRAIETPAQAAGWQFQPGLVDLILQEVGSEPGALPLLSHALLETWRRRQGRTLTLAGYAAAGGVRQAIAHTAEGVYARLTPDEQAIARGIFLRLTEPGEGVQDTRRRVALSELALAPEQQPALEAVLHLLADARLVTTAQDGAEVAHEALIREWPTLRRWLDEDREGLRLHRHITASAHEWARRGRDPGDLYSGSRLAQAQEWSARHVGQLNPLEREFVESSLLAARQAEAEREARRQKELAQAQKLAQTQRQRSLVLGVGLAVALVLAGVSFWFYSQSQTNLRMAARHLAAQAQAVYETYSSKQMLAVLLVMQSERISPSFEANQALLLQKNVQARTVARLTHDDTVGSVAFSPDGRYVASGSGRTVRVWEVASGREIARMIHDDAVWSVAFSQDGRYVVSGSLDNTAQVWEAVSGRAIARVTHDGFVFAVAFSPDSQYVVSGSIDGTARVWEAGSGKEIARMTCDDKVTSVAFSPDGRYVVSGVGDKTVWVWEAASGREVARMLHDGSVDSVAFSPDGRYVVSGGGWTARVWDAASGKEIARMTHNGNVNSVTFSPDGRYVVSGSWGDKTARVWEAANGKEISRMTHDSYVYSVAFSPDGRYVVSGSWDNTARVWEAASGREIARMTHDSYVYSVAFSPDGRYVVSGSVDKTARVWEIASGSAIARMTHDSYVYSVAFSPNGRYVVSGSIDARVWEFASGREIARMTHDGGAVRSVAFSPDGRYVVSGSGDGTARVWEAASGKEIARMTHAGSVESVAFSLDGRYVVSGSWDNTARIWESASGREIARTTHDDNVNSVAFSSDGRFVVSGSSDGTARVWDAASGREIARMIHNDMVNSVTFSPDGRHVVSGSWGYNTVRVWESASGKEIARVTHDDRVISVAFSPDGRYVVSGGWDKTARVWEVASGREIARMTHDDRVISVAFSPDGRYVVSGSWDKTARVWEAASGKGIARMTHAGSVDTAVFSPDGRYVISGSEDNTARVWLWRPADLIADACARLPRNLTRAEWAQYIGEAMPYQAVCPNLPLEP